MAIGIGVRRVRGLGLGTGCLKRSAGLIASAETSSS